MGNNSEKSNESKNKLYFRTKDYKDEEIIDNPEDKYLSTINIHKKCKSAVQDYNKASYGGALVNLNKSISELKIKERTKVIKFQSGEDNNKVEFKDETQRKLNITKSRESTKETQIGTKYHNHGVVLLFSNEDWKCQKCHIYKKKNESKYHCSLPECNFNICKKCVENNSKYPLSNFTHKQINLLKYKFSYHKHPLIYCRSSRKDNNFNFWNCNKCHSKFTNKIWSFYCTYCDFDLCLICAKKFVPRDDLLNESGIKINEHEHILIYLINNKNWSCNICSASYNPNIAKFYCSICDYNVCNNCKIKINNEKKNLNLNSNSKIYSDNNLVDTKYHDHSLIYCNTSRNEKETYWNCNVCRVKYGPQKWSFYCTKCDYDLCYNCFIKIKK